MVMTRAPQALDAARKAARAMLPRGASEAAELGLATALIEEYQHSERLESDASIARFEATLVDAVDRYVQQPTHKRLHLTTAGHRAQAERFFAAFRKETFAPFGPRRNYGHLKLIVWLISPKTASNERNALLAQTLPKLSEEGFDATTLRDGIIGSMNLPPRAATHLMERARRFLMTLDSFREIPPQASPAKLFALLNERRFGNMKLSLPQWLARVDDAIAEAERTGETGTLFATLNDLTRGVVRLQSDLFAEGQLLDAFPQLFDVDRTPAFDAPSAPDLLLEGHRTLEGARTLLKQFPDLKAPMASLDEIAILERLLTFLVDRTVPEALRLDLAQHLMTMPLPDPLTNTHIVLDRGPNTLYAQVRLLTENPMAWSHKDITSAVSYSLAPNVGSFLKRLALASPVLAQELHQEIAPAEASEDSWSEHFTPQLHLDAQQPAPLSITPWNLDAMTLNDAIEPHAGLRDEIIATTRELTAIDAQLARHANEYGIDDAYLHSLDRLLMVETRAHEGNALRSAIVARTVAAHAWAAMALAPDRSHELEETLISAAVRLARHLKPATAIANSIFDTKYPLGRHRIVSPGPTHRGDPNWQLSGVHLLPDGMGLTESHITPSEIIAHAGVIAAGRGHPVWASTFLSNAAQLDNAAPFAFPLITSAMLAAAPMMSTPLLARGLGQRPVVMKETPRNLVHLSRMSTSDRQWLMQSGYMRQTRDGFSLNTDLRFGGKPLSIAYPATFSEIAARLSDDDPLRDRQLLSTYLLPFGGEIGITNRRSEPIAHLMPLTGDPREGLLDTRSPDRIAGQLQRFLQDEQLEGKDQNAIGRAVTMRLFPYSDLNGHNPIVATMTNGYIVRAAVNDDGTPIPGAYTVETRVYGRDDTVAREELNTELFIPDTTPDSLWGKEEFLRVNLRLAVNDGHVTQADLITRQNDTLVRYEFAPPEIRALQGIVPPLERFHLHAPDAPTLLGWQVFPTHLWAEDISKEQANRIDPWDSSRGILNLDLPQSLTSRLGLSHEALLRLQGLRSLREKEWDQIDRYSTDLHIHPTTGSKHPFAELDDEALTKIVFPDVEAQAGATVDWINRLIERYTDHPQPTLLGDLAALRLTIQAAVEGQVDYNRLAGAVREALRLHASATPASELELIERSRKELKDTITAHTAPLGARMLEERARIVSEHAHRFDPNFLHAFAYDTKLRTPTFSEYEPPFLANMPREMQTLVAANRSITPGFDKAHERYLAEAEKLGLPENDDGFGSFLVNETMLTFEKDGRIDPHSIRWEIDLLNHLRPHLDIDRLSEDRLAAWNLATDIAIILDLAQPSSPSSTPPASGNTENSPPTPSNAGDQGSGTPGASTAETRAMQPLVVEASAIYADPLANPLAVGSERVIDDGMAGVTSDPFLGMGPASTFGNAFALRALMP